MHHLRDCPCGQGTCPIKFGEMRRDKATQNTVISEGRMFFEILIRGGAH